MQFFADSLDCLPLKRRCATFTRALGADANARPTSSLMCIMRVMKEEIGDHDPAGQLWGDARKGDVGRGWNIRKEDLIQNME